VSRPGGSLGAAAAGAVPGAAGVMAAIDWGPVSAWAGAAATVLATGVALLAAYRVPDAARAPRLRLTFGPTEPWCRRAAPGAPADGRAGYWVRVGVENAGREPARGCVGRLLGVTTDGAERPDVDPLQLRWAGVPRSRAFDPVDVRHDQREFLNVLALEAGARWRLVTFEDPDFDPGFSTELALDREHVLRIAVFADNAATATCTLVARVGARGDEITLRLRESESPAARDPRIRFQERSGNEGGQA
jgi:hypothetical protein